MKRKSPALRLLAVSCWLVILSMGVPMVHAVRNIGVEVGDQFMWSVDASFSSNDPTEKPLSAVTFYQDVVNITIVITNVTFPVVYYNLSLYYVNGTMQSGNIYCNVETGEGGFGGPMFVAANLSQGDIIFPQFVGAPAYSLWINETIPIGYGDSMVRELNYVNITLDYEPDNEWRAWENVSHQLVWDKETGVPVNLSIVYTDENITRSTTWSLAFTLIENTIWVIPEFPLGLILPLFVFLTFGVILKKRMPT